MSESTVSNPRFDRDEMTREVVRWGTHLNSTEDDTLHVLRIHLLIEEALRELIDLRMQAREHLQDARLSFAQACKLSRALYGDDVSDWVWVGIKKLNSLRNAMAHSLQPADKATRIADLRAWVQEGWRLDASSPLPVDESEPLRMFAIVLLIPLSLALQRERRATPAGMWLKVVMGVMNELRVKNGLPELTWEEATGANVRMPVARRDSMP